MSLSGSCRRACERKFVDVAIGAPIEDVLGVIGVIDGGVTGRIRPGACGRGGEVVVTPLVVEPADQFVEVTVVPAVDDVLAVVGIPGVDGGVADRVRRGACGRAGEVVVAPLVVEPADQFVEVTVVAAVDDVLVVGPGTAGGLAGRVRGLPVAAPVMSW
ncbi:hypothetical protein ACIRP7_36400 [Streptomyces sp. NPDC102270]|uniref:hypothetical protein n=1 Tax=Streptomyces sp. NPDC102270 TaxID=3366150 RepID=UPI0038246558